VVVFRRAVLVLVWMFWQGGFMFYGAVVVPVGSTVLGSDADQGFVTRSVTRSLNVAGVATLAVWAWDLASRRAGRGRVVSWALWGLVAALLGVLFWLHPLLDAHLDPHARAVLDHIAFRRLHRWYLCASTAQWALAVVLIWLTLRAWRDADSSAYLAR
jgi:hypothetical protein